jgi:hypothetical protein
MSQLADFTCKACSLSGTLPPVWLSVNLQKLLLSGNQLLGGLTAPLADPKAPPCTLQVLDLSYNKLDQVPELAFWNYTRAGLRELYLQSNTFPLVPVSGGHAGILVCCPSAMAAWVGYRLCLTHMLVLFYLAQVHNCFGFITAFIHLHNSKTAL